ncbi:MAG: cell division protein ZapA [Ignavibacteria bacterium]|jgi:cell division protein ZapA (FtsZ GTPase activity inhibitor)|nr:cell division protein ZapA [Ignavibacteria bacterium]
MSQSLIINIDNFDLSVVGDTELIEQSAGLLNDKITEITNKKRNTTSQERISLAALNIAEMGIVSDKEHINTIQSIVSEINIITDYLLKHIEHPE